MTLPPPAFVSSYTPFGSESTMDADHPSSAPRPLPFSAGEVDALLATLPGVISARAVTTPQGGVSDVHVLTGPDTSPHETVRNVEQALLATFGVRVETRRISVATTTRPVRRPMGSVADPQAVVTDASATTAHVVTDAARAWRPDDARRLYFEDVEARRSSRGGVSCRVVLRRATALASEADAFVQGEAESPGTMRARADEVAALAALDALARGEAAAASLSLEGSARVSAFGREFILVGVVARQGRGATLLTGSAEVRDGGAETAAVLAILDATNRWVARARDVGVLTRAAA